VGVEMMIPSRGGFWLLLLLEEEDEEWLIASVSDS